MYLGVKAVIAKSFERIHAANLVNFGIVPLTFKDEKSYDGFAQGDRMEIEDIRSVLEERGDLTVRNITKDTVHAVDYVLTDRQIGILLAGGALNYKNGS
jgi:aconitate hydratase